MEPIRVLNMFTIMNRGGAETMVMNYYRKIDKSKVQFDFLVHRQERGAYEDEIEAMGGRVYRMIPIYPQNFSVYKKMLRDFFEKHREYRIIHSHMSELGYFAFIEAKRQGIPVRICHAHSRPYGYDMKMVVRDYFKYKIRPYITHMFTCGTEAGEWLYGKQNKDNFIQLNNAVDTQKFCYDKSISVEVKRELEVEENFIVGHVGTFCKPKNHTFLLKVFKEILNRKKNAILILVGTGELFEEIKQQSRQLGIEERVRFLGTRTDIYRIMQTFDAFLFPSLFEGLPVTMVEAQAAGNLCFISDKVPKQCILTSNVKVISLEETAEDWAEVVLEESSKYKKSNMYEKIAAKKFDIVQNAKWLEEFYINV